MTYNIDYDELEIAILGTFNNGYTNLQKLLLAQAVITKAINDELKGATDD
jgi:hypothetical protein